MKQRIICKCLAVAVILLFLGLAVQPSVAVQPETEIYFEPKDYLFQTIIDIANNPEIKNLLRQYTNDMINFDIDKSVYHKIFLRNPRLMFNTLFTKPSISSEYLNKCYKDGIEVTNIISEDKVLEIIETVEVTDTEAFEEFNNIILNDEELSGRLVTLKEMNNELNPILDYPYPIICSILEFLLMPWIFLLDLVYYLQDFIFISLFLTFIVAFIGFIPIGVIVYFAWGFDCF